MVRGRGVAVTFEAGVAEAVDVRVAGRRVAGAGVGGVGAGAPHPRSRALATQASANATVRRRRSDLLITDDRWRRLT
jgi:hypothetical protein